MRQPGVLEKNVLTSDVPGFFEGSITITVVQCALSITVEIIIDDNEEGLETPMAIRQQAFVL